MGLPQTTRDVSEHPGPDGVTVPTNVKLSDATKDRTFALYGIVEAFRMGKYPTNEQIHSALDYAINNSPVDTTKLSSDGKLLIEDFREIVRTAQTMVDEKNKDELFQQFLFHTRNVDYQRANPKGTAVPVSKEDADRDGQEAAEHLRTLAKLIYTNSEARKLLKDISILGRDVAADATAKASDLARPGDDQLANVDTPAPSNEWVGPDGQKHGADSPVPDTGLAAKREEAERKKEQAKLEKEKAKEDAKESGKRVGEAADQNTATDTQGVANGEPNGFVPENQDQAKIEGEKAREGGESQAKAEKQRVQDQVSQRIPEERKEQAKEQYGKLKEYAGDKFPKERRERFIYRLKKVIVENQRHRDYQESIEFFIHMAETYSRHGKEVSQDGSGKLLDIRNDSSYQEAERELRTLLERFANGQSMQPIFDAVNEIYAAARQDDELRSWFSELTTYIRRVLQEPGYIMKEQADTEGREIRRKGDKFFNLNQGKYAPLKERFFQAVETFFRAYADDPINVKLGEDVKKLTKDLLFNEDGTLAYKPHLWEDIRSVILPGIVNKIGPFPVPRIEYTDKEVDLVIENLTLDTRNLLPNIVEWDARTTGRLSPYQAIKNTSKHSLTISFAQVQTDLRDVAFYFRKKSGFPKIQDSGFLDAVVSGEGISGKIHIESTGKKHHAFKVVDVDVKVDKVKFDIRGAKHQALYSLFRPLAKNLIKKQIGKAIEDAIRNGLVQLDAQISDIAERYEDAKEEAKANEDPQKGADLLKKAFHEKQEAAKREAEAKKPKGEFKLVGRRESKIMEWESDKSLVGKQAEKEEAAKKSDPNAPQWHSPAFSIA